MAFQEIRLTFRVLTKNRGFTAIAALSLALGIGANSAIFSLADALLLRPLPIRDPGAVVTVTTNTPDNPYSGVSYPNYRDLRSKSQSFEGVVAYQLSTWGVANSAGEIAQMRMGLIVSDNFFQVMGVEPTLGRSFRPEETQVPGRDAVVVLAQDFWKNQFALLGGPVGWWSGSLVGAGVVTVHLLKSHPQANLETGTVLQFTLTEPLHLTPSSESISEN